MTVGASTSEVGVDFAWLMQNWIKVLSSKSLQPSVQSLIDVTDVIKAIFVVAQCFCRRIEYFFNAPINVKPARDEVGHGVGIWLSLLALG